MEENPSRFHCRLFRVRHFFEVMKDNTAITQIRFLSRHRCPRCRMPLHAEEIDCPICELQIAYTDERGEVMVEMIAVDDPSDWRQHDLHEYLTMLEVEKSGDMFMPKQPLPTRPQRADLVTLADGALGIRFGNRVALEDVRKTKTGKAER